MIKPNSARSVTKPNAAAKKTTAAQRARKPAVKVNMSGLPKDYKKIGIFGEAKATQEQAAALIYLNNTDPQLNCSVDELVGLYWIEAGREACAKILLWRRPLLKPAFSALPGDDKTGTE